MSVAHNHQEAVMGQAIPRQHPAVVLRSQYRQLRALLAIALAVVAGLGLTVVILATDDESATTVSSVRPVEPIAYGGFNPLTGTPVQSTRPAGGPEETGVAAAIAPKPNVASPDESKIAAAISRTQMATGQSGPDESSVAAAIGRRR
jgi:hypothetical protein